MSEARLAQVRATRRDGAYLDVELEVGSPPSFRAGQWLAVHTALPHPDKPGQTLKRAWSIAQAEGSCWRLFVAVVGPASTWLAARRPGELLRFTGPWGTRFGLDEGEEPVGLYAIGSGISPIGALADHALRQGRAVRLRWETPHEALKERLRAWAAAGVELEVGPHPAAPEADRPWWFAGPGPRVDELCGDAPISRIERFSEGRAGGAR